MEEHSQSFKSLENHFQAIQQYETNRSININNATFGFYIDLNEITTNFYGFYESLLLDEELATVQGWINKILGNCYISMKMKERIAKANIDFASMVESINNSHVDTIDFNR